MLGDNPEKSKNPLKKAMRRRNAKTVQFSAPTYHEAADVEYSTEEEEEGEESYLNGEDSADGQNGAYEDGDEITSVEPLRPRNQNKEVKGEATGITEGPHEGKDSEELDNVNDLRTSDEIFDRQGSTSSSPAHVVRC